MDFKEYREIVKHTFLEEYPIYFLDMFIKKLAEEDIVYNDKRKSIKKKLIDITELDSLKDKVVYLFKNLDTMVKRCEEFEYERAYRYSYMYKIKNFNSKVIEELIEDKKIILYTDDDECNDFLGTYIFKPTCRIEDEMIILKFSIELKSKLDNERSSKHTILGIINEKLNTFEIRQDVVSVKYQNNDDFYTRKAREVKAWIISLLKCELEDIDFQAIVKYMKTKKKEDLIITAVKFERDGMVAELDSAKNINLTLPILDELRHKIHSMDIFEIDDNTRNIKKILEEFIVDIEENSSLPAAKILWKNKGYELSSYHQKVEGQDCFFRWNKSLRDKESMDYVAKYFIECEKELIESFDN